MSTENKGFTAKGKTDGADPKVIIQAVVTIIGFLLSYFGLDLEAEAATAIGVALGGLVAVLGPAAKLKNVELVVEDEPVAEQDY
jgi:hypothetical protein